MLTMFQCSVWILGAGRAGTGCLTLLGFVLHFQPHSPDPELPPCLLLWAADSCQPGVCGHVLQDTIEESE